MSSYLYNMIYGSAGYNIVPYVSSAVSPFAAMAGAAVAPLTPKPSQFVQQGFPMPPKAPTAPTTTTPFGGGQDKPLTGGTTISGQTTGGMTIGPANLATPEQYAEAAQVGGYLDKVTGQVGLQTQVNPLSGTVGVTAPGFFGMMGAGFISPITAGVSKFMQDKQTQAVQNALAIDNTQNGVISINGMNVSIVNGKLYGNIGDLDYNTVRTAALNYLQENPYSPPSIPGAAQEQAEDTLAYSYGEVGRVPSGSYEVGRVIGSEPSAPSSPSVSSPASDGNTGNNNGPTSGVGGGIGGQMGGPRAYGGLVGFAAGGRVSMANGDLALNPGQAGFVDGPPEQFTPAQTVADTENGQVQEGSFVINAPAVEFAGSDDIRKMILDAYATAKEKGLDIGNVDRTIYEKTVDVALSKGEVVVPPALVKIIGLDRLRKINNRGKREVGERQQQAAKGGFINGYADGDVVSDVGEEIPYDTSITLPKSTEKKFKAFLKSKKNRASVEKLIDVLTDKERLAVLGLVETTASTDPVESMMAVGQVAMNRAASNRPDFKDVNDLASVMKQRSYRGSGSRMFQYDGLEPTNLKKRLTEIVEGRAPDAVSKMFTAAETLTSPEYEFDPIFPSDVMFYTAPDAPLAKEFENNPLMQYFTTLSGHDYYSLMAAPELP